MSNNQVFENSFLNIGRNLFKNHHMKQEGADYLYNQSLNMITTYNYNPVEVTFTKYSLRTRVGNLNSNINKLFRMEFHRVLMKVLPSLQMEGKYNSKGIFQLDSASALHQVAQYLLSRGNWFCVLPQSLIRNTCMQFCNPYCVHS